MESYVELFESHSDDTNMAESISSLSTDVDRSVNGKYSWDITLFFDQLSKCEEHPDFLQARPILRLPISRYNLKQYFVLRNTKKFAVCYKITCNSSFFNLLPIMGVIDPETEVSYVLIGLYLISKSYFNSCNVRQGK